LQQTLAAISFEVLAALVEPSTTSEKLSALTAAAVMQLLL
jgi:hypothetical protein